MSDTKVDMPKVCQMFDAGWSITMYKNQMGSYTVEAEHVDDSVVSRASNKLKSEISRVNPDWDYDTVELCGEMNTDDFTPEQALTRMAYKVHGEII